MRISKKLTTAISGIVTTALMWATGELEAGPAIAAIAVIASTYMAAQGLVDFGLAKSADEERLKAIELDAAKARAAALEAEDVSGQAREIVRRVLEGGS